MPTYRRVQYGRRQKKRPHREVVWEEDEDGDREHGGSGGLPPFIAWLEARLAEGMTDLDVALIAGAPRSSSVEDAEAFLRELACDADGACETLRSKAAAAAARGERAAGPGVPLAAWLEERTVQFSESRAEVLSRLGLPEGGAGWAMVTAALNEVRTRETERTERQRDGERQRRRVFGCRS